MARIEGKHMTEVSRRKFLVTGAAGAAGVFAGGSLLAACGGDDGGGAATTTAAGTAPPTPAPQINSLTLQSLQSDPVPREAMEEITALWNAQNEPELILNTVSTEIFRTQLPTYLTSSEPPDAITWLAGSVARDYARDGLLLDLSDVWESDFQGFSPALKDLSTDADGRQIFVPTNYYWISCFYRKSKFEEWGVTPPETWDDFMSVCETIKSQGADPITMGTGTSAWVASNWFDYLNLRVNGAEYHLELLAGEHRFDDPEVRETMRYFEQILPFVDPNGRSFGWQEATTPLAQGNAGMYLIGAFMTSVLPEDIVPDIDFFRVPIIDPAIPAAEEAPTDGYFVPSRVRSPEDAKRLAAFLGGKDAQQIWIGGNTSRVGTHPDLDTSNVPEMTKRGIDHLNNAASLTQFFNRDSSDALQVTADAALTRFLDQPENVDSILTEWQTAAEEVFTA